MPYETDRHATLIGVIILVIIAVAVLEWLFGN